MDGTLLDKHFDDYFWEHLVPERYAEQHAMPLEQAKEELTERYRMHEGTLNWTDLDFWSGELNLDIPALKEQVKHLIEVHPHVEDFLKLMKEMEKMVFLVTNAHYKSINLKFRETQIGKYFDSVLSSFDVGFPKEDLHFWVIAEERLGFDRQATLFIDDTEKILRTAREYGIRYVIFKARANSRIQPNMSDEFMRILDFDELIPVH